MKQPSEAPCACVGMRVCAALSIPGVVPFLCLPPFSAEVSGELDPVTRGRLLLSVDVLCALSSSQSDDVLHALLFEHAQLLALFFQKALVPGKCASEDFLGVQNSCHLG